MRLTQPEPQLVEPTFTGIELYTTGLPIDIKPHVAHAIQSMVLFPKVIKPPFVRCLSSGLAWAGTLNNPIRVFNAGVVSDKPSSAKGVMVNTMRLTAVQRSPRGGVRRFAWFKKVQDLIGDLALLQAAPASEKIIAAITSLEQLEGTRKYLGYRLAVSQYWAVVLATTETPYCYLRKRDGVFEFHGFSYYASNPGSEKGFK